MVGPRQTLKQLLEAKQQSLFEEEEASTAGRRPRPTIDDEKYQKLKGKQRLAAFEADLAEWEGGSLTNLPQGSEYAPSASASEGPQGDIFQEQQSIFGLAPRESAEDPQQIFGRGEQEARQEWDELGEGYTEEDQAEREEYFESVQEERKNPAIQFTAEELEAAKNEPDEGTGFNIPEIRAARVRRDNAPQNTDEIKTQEREALRDRLADKAYNTDIENRQRNRQAWIVLGPPGAGKTTAIIAELKREQGALEVDSDIVKEGLPEFEGGVNAQSVHRESARIIEQRVLPRAIKAGDNIAVPRVGTRDDTITELISDLKADGYTTHLVLVNLSPIKAAGRVTVRFLKTGRFVDPDPGIATFKSMDADVPLGRSPRTIEEGSNESQQERGRDLRLRRGERRGVQGSSSVEGEGGQGTGRGRGQEGEGEAQPDLPLEGHHPLAPRSDTPPVGSSPAFKRWFGKSKVTTPLGNPKPVYHSGAFDPASDPVPRTGLEGMHFGTLKASSDRRRLLDDAGVSSPSGQTTEVYLSIQNPVRIEDQGDWTVDDVYKQVREQVEFTSEERKSIEQAVLSDKKKAGFEALKSALNKHG